MFLKIASFLVMAIVVMVGGAYAWYYYGFAKPIHKEFSITINPGSSVAQIASELKKAGVISSEWAFKAYAKTSGLAAKLQAGEYKLPSGIDGPALVKMLTQGKVTKDEKVVLVREGQTNKEIENYVHDNNLIIDGSFYRQATVLTSQLPLEWKTKYPFLAEAPTKVDLEGYLFPDTYRLFKDDNGEVLVTKMLDNFKSKVTEQMMTDIKAQKKTLYQILIMASLLEKEVRGETDMKVVSGLFWNRLRDSERLESCATLAYLLGVNKPIYTIEDTQIDSPYNTYRNDGLPPTPIGNPGIAAINAAIYPTPSDYKFFLSRPDTGETVFAKTYQEHLDNKNKYLK